ncbi:MAG TPA: SLC13 family permease [Limnochordales bacterium]
MNKVIAYILLVGAVALITSLTGFTGQQVLATTIFSGFIFGTLFFWEFRLAFALTGIALLFASGMLDVEHFIEFASLDVIMFLIGMMIVIGYLEEKDFFARVLDRVLPSINKGAVTLMVALMGLSFISAALVDEVTSILFMAAITMRIAKHYGLSPVPYIIMVVFATNIGSSATVVGNPIGVLIALRAGLSFPDFLRWATPISVVAWVVTVVLSFWYFRKPMAQLQAAIKERAATASHESGGDILVPSLLFVGTIAGLLLHKNIEAWLGLEHNIMLIGVAMLAAGIVLFIERRHAKRLVETRVDWWTLVFFMLLFASAGTLQYVGVTEHIAESMVQATRGNLTTLFFLITWSVGAITAVMDNVLAVASFIPIVGDLADVGVAVAPLWWGMLMGGTILGNLTFIGSTANIVAIGMLERQEGRGVTFMEWFWPGLATSVPSLLVATLLLYVQIPLMLR